MGHTHFKKKKKRWTTQKKWRGGATITKTKQVQQSFDTIHDFYQLARGLFGSGLDPGVAALERKLATLPAGDPRHAQTQASLQYAQSRVPFIPLYQTMKAVMQYMIITLNSIKFDIPIGAAIHTPGSIRADTQFALYTGNKKEGQLFYAGQGNPSSKVSASGIEIQGREYFEIPPGREWPKLNDMESSFINLAGMLFNLNDNPDQDTIHAYNTALNQPPNTPIPPGARLTDAHRIYMLCDAGANTYGKLAESVRANLPGGKPGQKSWDGAPGTLRGPRVTEFVTPLTTADSASSNPYEDHEFIFVASGADMNEFISDANLYTNDIYQIKYVRDQWDASTGLGFKLVVSPIGSNEVLFELVYGLLGEGQVQFVRPAGSRAQPVIYNSQGPSAASLSGCALLRALHSVPAVPGIAVPAGVFQDIPEEKIGNPNNLIRSPQRVRDMVAANPLPELTGTSLREQIVSELTRIMTQQNGVSDLCGTANMVDPYSLLGDRFGSLPSEIWFDIKRGGDRDQVKAAHYLSQLRDANGNLLYPFIHFVTGDELAAKMAVELGLAVIYQANGNIRYWPKMFRFRPESRTIPAPYGITTQPAPEAAQGPWAIAQWGGKRMKGGLRNPNGAIPSYTRIEDKDGVQYFFDNYNFGNSNGVMIMKGINDQGQNNRPNIIAHDIWLNPSNYVVMKNQVQPTNPTITPASLLADIRAQYQQIPQTPELPERELTADEWNTIASGLSNIDYRPLPPVIKQAIINVLQGIQLLQTNNSGIYQYDFINTLFGNNPQLNPLDELTFRIVYDSKEDDGLQGAVTIGENSPQVTVTSDDGQHQWTIPALLDENLLDYDIAFMANRFTQTLRQYSLGIQEVSQEFITRYGIHPIVSYIQSKYADNAPNDVQQRVVTAIMTSAQQSVSSSPVSSRPATPETRSASDTQAMDSGSEASSSASTSAPSPLHRTISLASLLSSQDPSSQGQVGPASDRGPAPGAFRLGAAPAAPSLGQISRSTTRISRRPLQSAITPALASISAGPAPAAPQLALMPPPQASTPRVSSKRRASNISSQSSVTAAYTPAPAYTPALPRAASAASAASPSTPYTPALSRLTSSVAAAITPAYASTPSPAAAASTPSPVAQSDDGNRNNGNVRPNKGPNKRSKSQSTRLASYITNFPSNIMPGQSQGGKRHTKKKHHKRKKRETQRKRSH
jgi:hypothetical protein